jgi:hypothetical protein
MGELHDTKYHNLYTSSKAIGVIKLMRIGWEGHREEMEEMRNSCDVF